GQHPRPVSRPRFMAATGMAASDTLDVEFTNISAQPVGEPGRYIDRPGFAHGGAGVAACWYGGARGVARTLLAAAAERDMGRTPRPTSASSWPPAVPRGRPQRKPGHAEPHRPARYRRGSLGQM